MDGYKALGAWQAAKDLCLNTLAATENISSRRTWAVTDQLRRAVISVDVNIVEGYALGTAPLFRRHLRIALGSAAEAERLLQIASERGYLPPDMAESLNRLADLTIRRLYGLLRSPHLPVRSEPSRRPRPASGASR